MVLSSGSYSEAGKGVGVLSFPRGPRTLVLVFENSPGLIQSGPTEATWIPGHTDPALGPVQLLWANAAGDSGQVTQPF